MQRKLSTPTPTTSRSSSSARNLNPNTIALPSPIVNSEFSTSLFSLINNYTSMNNYTLNNHLQNSLRNSFNHSRSNSSQHTPKSSHFSKNSSNSNLLSINIDYDVLSQDNDIIPESKSSSTNLSRNSQRSILQNLVFGNNKTKILVFGSINIDDFFKVPHIVHNGETITSSSYFQRAGGKGVKVWHAGKIGQDGIWIKENMSKQNVNVDNIIVSNQESTGRAFIQLSQDTGDNAIVLLPGANHKFNIEEVKSILNQEFKKGDWLVLQNEIGIIDLLKILSKKFPSIIGIIITLGEKGLIAWYKPEKKIFTLPSLKIKVCDTTGAGDTFIGYFVASLVRNQQEKIIQEEDQIFLMALKEATVAAGLAVSKLGAMESIPHLTDVRKNLKSNI
ncbi:11126_t:CDS:2 [Diversispora eburnea]|uniref:11126_t:CDS:1 n=1 Tax=Diversispora eburnea TaxID=1213867 RepID=A0A9N9FAA6_9GLOM|nr:11126_t:CDS:2 [Diversispora eburnea]